MASTFPFNSLVNVESKNHFVIFFTQEYNYFFFAELIDNSDEIKLRRISALGQLRTFP